MFHSAEVIKVHVSRGKHVLTGCRCQILSLQKQNWNWIFPSDPVHLFTSISALTEADRIALKAGSRNVILPDILKTSSVYLFRCSCFTGWQHCDSLRAGAVRIKRSVSSLSGHSFLGYCSYLGNVPLQNYVSFQSH